MKYTLQWSVFIIGLIIFSAGIAMTVNVQHLGLHPWDVLNVAFSDRFGLTFGTWAIIVSIFLIIVAFFLDRTYIKFGTFVNAVLIGALVDLYLWSGILPVATHTWIDIFTMLIGIVIMGVGGGIYNAAGLGSGPRDGFMLSISDKTGMSIRRVRITVESLVLIIGFLLGGPVFVFTILFTFIQSPIFEYAYIASRKMIERVEEKFERISMRENYVPNLDKKKKIE